MNYLIDGGWRFGEAMNVFNVIDQAGWHVHAFEPNPALLFDEFSEARNITRHRKAIWISDETINFSQFECPEFGGSVSGCCCITQESFKVPFIATGNVDVKAIDISKFLKELPEREKLLVKLDIEGAEFHVIRHLLSTGTIDLINGIWIEFHQRWSDVESSKTTLELIAQIQSRGIPVYHWA